MSANEALDFNNENITETRAPVYGEKVLRMMEKMGYQCGLGLGKNQQGITEPISTGRQFKRKGLGSETDSGVNLEWNALNDPVDIQEPVEWLHNAESFPYDLVSTLSWLKEDAPITKVEDECNFCDTEILHQVISAKEIFNDYDVNDLNQARARANPFETIRSVFFMNRASLKIANIDAATGFIFTKIDESPLHKNDPGPYYFADVCAGPGGFTEYILWRRKWLFKGFGFTLKGDNDFKLTNSVCASPVTFLPFYGVHDDGNICCPENINDFQMKILFETEQEGVHFMMSDGGFSVEGNENYQEVLSKNIYVCQCLTALLILRQHGHFVTKMFDLFTRFSVGLLFLLYHCFEKICILKPNSSRPANAERYVICYNFKGRTKVTNIITYLKDVVERLWKIKYIEDLDIVELVPLSILKSDEKFYSYITKSNNRLAQRQFMNLEKLAVFCKNPTLHDGRQDELRKKCLEFWQIPDEPKWTLERYTVENVLEETVTNMNGLFTIQPRVLSSKEDINHLTREFDNWHYTYLQGSGNNYAGSFFAGVGQSRVFRFQNYKWSRIKNVQLSQGTLLYGEFVKENIYVKDMEAPICKYTLHAIDALRLGHLNLMEESFEDRCKQIRIFCKSVNHEFKKGSIRIRPKVFSKLQSLERLPLDKESQKPIFPLSTMGFNSCKEECEVNSIMFFKSNKGQTFYSSYVLRTQILFNEKSDLMDSLLRFVRNNKCTAQHLTN